MAMDIHAAAAVSDNSTIVYDPATMSQVIEITDAGSSVLRVNNNKILIGTKLYA